MVAALDTASTQPRKAPARHACTQRRTARRVACCSCAFSCHWFHAAARSRLAIFATAPASFACVSRLYVTRPTQAFQAAWALLCRIRLMQSARRKCDFHAAQERLNVVRIQNWAARMYLCLLSSLSCFWLVLLLTHSSLHRRNSASAAKIFGTRVVRGVAIPEGGPACGIEPTDWGVSNCPWSLRFTRAVCTVE